MGKKKKKERHSESMGSCKTQHRENKGHSIWNSLREGGQPSPRGNSAGSRRHLDLLREKPGSLGNPRASKETWLK